MLLAGVPCDFRLDYGKHVRRAATLIAAPVGLLYNGTAIPAIMATLICSALAWFLMGFLRD